MAVSLFFFVAPRPGICRRGSYAKGVGVAACVVRGGESNNSSTYSGLVVDDSQLPCTANENKSCSNIYKKKK